MVDGISFNPFTGKVFTEEEIEKIDTNKDSIISQEELNQALSWLSGGNDTDEEVSISDQNNNQPVTLTERGDSVFKTAQSNGLKESVQKSNELSEELTKVENEYIELILNEKGISDSSEISLIVSFLKNQKTEFIKNYTEQNPSGPYDMKAVTAAYIQAMDTAIQEREESLANVNNTIETIKASGEDFDMLTDAVSSAGNYISEQEYKNIKDQSIQYILGQMLNNITDTAFLSAINPNYAKNTNYIDALNCIKSLQNCSDPKKMQEYLAKAQDSLSKFIGNQNVDGTSKLTNAIASAKETKAAEKQAKATEQYKTELSSVIDKMVETYSNTKIKKLFRKRLPKESEIKEYETKLNNIMDAFLAQYKGDGTNISSEFQSFVTKTENEYTAIKKELNSLTIAETSSNEDPGFNTLETLVKAAGNYISDSEKTAIIKAASNLFLLNLSSNDTVSSLSSIYPGYQTDENFVEAKKLFDGLKTSGTPKEDFAKIKELLTKMVEKLDIDNIKNGVKEEKSKNINLDTAELTSGLPYYGDSITNSNKKTYKINPETNQVEYPGFPKVEQMMNSLYERIKTQLSSQLGDLYDESLIQECFTKAQTLACNESIPEPRLIGRMFLEDVSVDTQTLVDLTIKNFNQILTETLKNQNTYKTVQSNYTDKSLYKEGKQNNIIKAKYNRSQDGSIYLNNAESNKTYQEQMKTLYDQLVDKYKSQMGDNFNETEFQTWFNEAQNNALSKICSDEICVDGYRHLGICDINLILNQTLHELDLLLNQR